MPGRNRTSQLDIPPYEVWVEISCDLCSGQIAGMYTKSGIQYQSLTRKALTVGAVHVDGIWICRGCAEKVAAHKKKQQEIHAKGETKGETN